MKRLLGLYREPDYSPGRHQSNDSLIIEQVAERLRRKDFLVDLKTIQTVETEPRNYDLVLSMCQGREALEELQRWESSGIPVVNSARAARNAHRDRITELMRKARIPFPETQLVSTDVDVDEIFIPNGCGIWIKRGDVHASVAADVQRIDSSAALKSALGEFASRGIEVAVIQNHQPGTEIKFYAVGSNHFFYWLPARGSLLKSTINSDESELRGLAGRAAAVTGLEIFGGDVIVSESGALTLIDLNDWPSFAPCRNEASSAIADFIAARVQSQRPVTSANQNAL